MHYEKRRNLRKRLPARVKKALVAPSEPNTTWSIDFVSDALESGRKFRVLNEIGRLWQNGRCPGNINVNDVGTCDKVVGENDMDTWQAKEYPL